MHGSPLCQNPYIPEEEFSLLLCLHDVSETWFLRATYLSSYLYLNRMSCFVCRRLWMLSKKQSVLFVVLWGRISQGPLKPLSNLVNLFTGTIGNAVPGWLTTYFHSLSLFSNKSMHFKSPLSMEMCAQNTGWASWSSRIRVVCIKLGNSIKTIW